TIGSTDGRRPPGNSAPSATVGRLTAKVSALGAGRSGSAVTAAVSIWRGHGGSGGSGTSARVITLREERGGSGGAGAPGPSGLVSRKLGRPGAGSSGRSASAGASTCGHGFFGRGRAPATSHCSGSVTVFGRSAVDGTTCTTRKPRVLSSCRIFGSA